jgi:lipopolysaccharide/colanic/teichoic acid biosynthesis glycosyltransferase
VTPAVKLAKRALDLVASSVGLAVTVPLYPLIGAAIWLDSPGPLFYRQKRAGELIGTAGPGSYRFREFDMLKFRTMRPDAEKQTGAVLASECDPRVTRIGRILRRTRIDELPQFWNVLVGDMSLVGPRPERGVFIEKFRQQLPTYAQRHQVKSGITGLAQINLGYSGSAPDGSPITAFKEQLTNPFKLDGADDAEADDMRLKMLFDLAYSATLEKFGSFLTTELSVIAKTPLVMLKGLGR